MAETISTTAPADSVVVYDTMREVATALKAHYYAQFPHDTADPKHAAVLQKLASIKARLRQVDPRDIDQLNALRQEFQLELEQNPTA